MAEPARPSQSTPSNSMRAQKQFGVSSAYLVLYNLLQTAGWTYVLYLGIAKAVEDGSLTGVYPIASHWLCVCQGLSLLETVHAAIGLVRGSPVTSFVQWFGRSHALFAVLECIPELWTTKEAGILVIVWAAIEIIRYPWYALSLLNACPSFLTWLRYTAFIPLYPVGVYAEMASLYLGLPYMEAKKLHCVLLPNKYNFGFYYPWFVKGGLCVYPLIWLQLYTFMFKQRSKKLGGGDSSAKRKTL